MNITGLSLTALSARLSTGELRAWDVTQAYLDRIRRHDGDLHAFQTVAADQALAVGELDIGDALDEADAALAEVKSLVRTLRAAPDVAAP